MDDSLYYDGRGDGDSPMLSPLTPNFDRYISRTDGSVDESPYFGDTYAPIQGGGADDYSMGSRGSVNQQDSGFSLDFLPTGNTLPRSYPGGGAIGPAETSPANRSWDVDSSEELQLPQRYFPPSSFDTGYANDGYGFLPSPPDGDDGAGYGVAATTPGTTGRSRGKKSSSSNDKKRKHQSTMPSSSLDKKKSEEKSKDNSNQNRPPTQLRTASRAPKKYSQATSRRPAESVEEVKARAAHNQVEQQYRKRLNQQFERLLAVLPQPDCDEDMGDDSEGGGGRGGSVDKRISKAEVLDLARRRIRVLEKEKASLEKQKKELASSLARMQDEWTRRLGGVPVKSEGK